MPLVSRSATAASETDACAAVPVGFCSRFTDRLNVGDHTPLSPADKPVCDQGPSNNRTAAAVTGSDGTSSKCVDRRGEDDDKREAVSTNDLPSEEEYPEYQDDDYDFPDDEIEMLQGPSSPSTQPDPPVQASARAPVTSARSSLAGPGRFTSSKGMLDEDEDGGPAPATKIQLSHEQKLVLTRVRKGESVFFTGSAGTGKSVLLREIIRVCRSGGLSSSAVAVTASTGIASVNVGGGTLHSWAGIGLGKEDKDALVAKIYGISAKDYKADLQKRKAWNAKLENGKVPLTSEDIEFLPSDPGAGRKNAALDRWRDVKTLIIDESKCSRLGTL